MVQFIDKRKRRIAQNLWWDTYIGALNNGASYEDARTRAYKVSRIAD